MRRLFYFVSQTVLSVLVLSGFAVNSGLAAEPIAVVFDGSKSFAKRYIEKLKQAEQTLYTYIPIDIDQLPNHTLADYQAVIAVSSEVSNELLKRNINTPVLHVMSPQVNVNQLANIYPMKNQNWFLLSDQPGLRMYALLDQISADRKVIGVLYSQENTAYVQQLKQLLRFTSYELKAYTADADDVRDIIDLLVKESDVLLAIPDKLLFDRINVRWLLYSAFQKNIPIVAFSKAFVDAGAIAAVYSTERDFAQQTQELLSAMYSSPQIVHRKIYPQYYRVATNAFLQRNLSISLESEAQLEKMVKSTVEQYEKDIQQARH